MTGNQRWRERRSLFRRPDEQIRTSEYEVASLPDDRQAKTFVTTHHYSRSYPAARFRFGLFRHGELVGVAVFSHPTNDRVLTHAFPALPRATDAVELGRLVLLDAVPGNGESWFVARCFRHLRQQGMGGVVSFADPVPRTTADGRVVFRGHIGTVYQASNAAYLGRGTARTLRVLPDGTVFSERALSKIRRQERGWQYAVRQLVEHGAEPPEEGRALAGWLATWLGRLTRPLRHRGNHKYCWSLQRRRPVCGLPYPKHTPA